MIAAPLVMASHLAGRETDRLKKFGETLGLLFQLTDDLLDDTAAKLGKTPGKDRAEGKFTALKVYGREGASALCGKYQTTCHDILGGLDANTAFMHGIVDMVAGRDR